jgi:transcriptional regulator with XRE-family HTH domain
MRKLTRARVARGWTVDQAARGLGLSRQTLRNLERVGTTTRDTIPSRVTAFTMVRILEEFPELELADFVPGTKLQLKRRAPA